MATASDEAYGLLILENCWDKWWFEAENSKTDVDKARREKTFPRSKYTVGRRGPAKRNGGWSNEGLKRYRELGQETVKHKKGDLDGTGDEEWTKLFYKCVKDYSDVIEDEDDKSKAGQKDSEEEAVEVWIEEV